MKQEEIEIRNKEICDRFQAIMDDDDLKISAWQACDVIRQELETKEIKLTQPYIWVLVKEKWNISREHESKRRFFKLRRLEKEAVGTKKDVLDILEQQRKEIEGDKPLVDQSQHNTLIVRIEKYGSTEDIQATRRTMASI